MLIILSPSKKLDYDTPSKLNGTQPRLLNESQVLIDTLKKLTQSQVSQLMSLSEKLAELNYHRYRSFSVPFTPENARPAIEAFKGDVYDGLQAESFSEQDIAYAEKHLRILSGLYGLLQPLDLMQAYRLEMGTRLKTVKGKNLYEFWGDKILELLCGDMNAQGDDVLINLASNEYYKSVQRKEFKGRIITPSFKEYKNGQYKMLMLFAKRARGSMARFIIQNKLAKPEELKQFNLDGYAFNAKLSEGDNWVFTRGEN